MAPRSSQLSDKAALPFKSSNKIRRQNLHIKQKKARDSQRREQRFSRKKDEAQRPHLREQRLSRNVPHTLDRKRTWDAFVDDDNGDAADDILGRNVDLDGPKKRKVDSDDISSDETDDEELNGTADFPEDDDEDHDSMLDDDSDDGDDDDSDDLQNTNGNTKMPAPSSAVLSTEKDSEDTRRRSSGSPTRSVTSISTTTTATTTTTLPLVPESLFSKFSSLFPDPENNTPTTPKILITTTLNSTLHRYSALLTNLFPNSTYIPRSAHKHSHKFSLREISQFASRRDFTAILVLTETLKRPTGLTAIHLPSGPTFHFSISNWYSGTQIPNHGRATGHRPELILNNFRTPLGVLTAHLFRSLFPPSPDLEGRQVVTLHNQRDYIFLRRHRYVFRDKRETERSVTDPHSGKEVKGVEKVRAGLQELGPRMTLKLRRIDKGIQRGSGQEWEWKGRMEKVRTKFQL